MKFQVKQSHQIEIALQKMSVENRKWKRIAELFSRNGYREVTRAILHAEPVYLSLGRGGYTYTLGKSQFWNETDLLELAAKCRKERKNVNKKNAEFKNVETLSVHCTGSMENRHCFEDSKFSGIFKICNEPYNWQYFFSKIKFVTNVEEWHRRLKIFVGNDHVRGGMLQS